MQLWCRIIVFRCQVRCLDRCAAWMPSIAFAEYLKFSITIFFILLENLTEIDRIATSFLQVHILRATTIDIDNTMYIYIYGYHHKSCMVFDARRRHASLLCMYESQHPTMYLVVDWWQGILGLATFLSESELFNVHLTNSYKTHLPQSNLSNIS